MAIGLLISVRLEGADTEELDELTRSLRRELLDVGVQTAVPPRPDAAPPDAKGDPVTVGTLAVAVLPAVLPKLIELVQNWTQRGRRNLRVKIQQPEADVEIELPAAAEAVELILRLGQSSVPNQPNGRSVERQGER